jgi:hypothetical protein
MRCSFADAGGLRGEQTGVLKRGTRERDEASFEGAVDAKDAAPQRISVELEALERISYAVIAMDDSPPIEVAGFRYVRMVAQYRPFSFGEHRIALASRQLVLAAIHASGEPLGACTEVQSVCRAVFGLEFEREEISTSIAQLEEDEKLVRDSSGLTVSDGTGRELAARIRGSKEVEATAFREWDQVVRQKIAPELGDQHLAQLHDDLRACIDHIIADQGIVAAVLLYPEHENCRRQVEEIKTSAFAELPHRTADVRRAREEALNEFLENMTPMQRRYFYDLVSTAYLLSVVTLPPAILDGVRHLISGQQIYLDTNMAYSILNLHSPRRYTQAERALALSRQLGYQPAVTPWTLKELQRSVQTARDKLARRQASPRAAASLRSTWNESDGDEVFIRAFRKLERDGKTNFKEFFALHEHVESLLLDQDIPVIEVGCQAVDEERDRLDEEIAWLERVRQGPEKPRALQEHDVKHRLLIESLGGRGERRLSNAGCLFLTDDQALVRYGKATRRNRRELPFAITIDEWGRIVRALCPRTDDYDKTMVNMRDTRILGASELMTQSEIINAIDRVNSYEPYSHTTGVLAMLDTALDGGGDEVGPEFYEASETVAAAKIGELTAVVAGLREELTVERSRVAAEKRRRAADRASRAADTATMNEQLRALRRTVADTEQQLRHLRARSSDDHGSEQVDANHIEVDPAHGVVPHSVVPSVRELSRQVAQQGLIIRGLVASLIALMGVAMLAVPLGTQWITTGWPLVGDICGGTATLIGAFACLFGRKRACALVTGIGAVVGIIAAIEAFVT